jgi:hypothetical protein
MAGWFGKMRRALGRWTGARPPSLKRGPTSPGAPPPAPAVPFVRSWPEESVAWRAATDPGAMLTNLGDRASQRKLRLFAAACCRPLVGLIEGEWFREGVELVERQADDSVSVQEVDFCRAAAMATQEGQPEEWEIDAESAAARAIVWLLEEGWLAQLYDVTDSTAQALAHLAEREVFPASAPFRPARPEQGNDVFRREQARQCALLREVFGDPFLPKSIDPMWLAANDGAAVHLARGIYEGRAYEEMPILADALEEAGCDDTDMLWHCRHGKDHVRGCWVVDLLLGKE